MSYGFLRRWSAESRSVRVEVERAVGTRLLGPGGIECGMTVVDCLGARVGSVARVEETGLIVTRRPWQASLALPTSYVGEVHARLVVLNRPRALLW